MDGHVIRLFVLDDHEVVRRGLVDLFSAEPDLEVVAEAGTAAEALSRATAARPDVAILDVRLPDGDGVAVCRELRSRMANLRCLMLTSFSDDQALFDAIMAGAAGYVLKQIRGADLIGAVRTVASGESLLDHRATARVFDRLQHGRSAKDDPMAELSAQERLELIGQGMTNRQIAEHMYLAEKTVKNYVSHVLTKLGLLRRTQAAILATEQRRARPAATNVTLSRG